MKTTTNILIAVIIGMWVGTVTAQDLPDKAEVLAQMTLANDYFMAKWPDPGAPIVHPDRTRTSNLWTRATYYEGLMALYELDLQERYYDYAVAWGQGNDWSLRFGRDSRHADPQCAGQTYIDLYLIDPQPERIETIKYCIDHMVDNRGRDDWTWIDALQMAMPVFARLGTMYYDEDPNLYYQPLYELYSHTKTQEGRNGLYNSEDHLWWRDADFDPPYTSPNGEDCYWSRGNGWVLAALVRVLDIMPEDAVGRADYLQTFQEMCAALLAVQREDGFWNVSLHDPNEYGGPELSGTAFFAYGMAWGLRQGILDEEAYLPAVIKAWDGMVTQSLHDNGFLGYVQGTGKEPASSQPVGYDTVPNFEDFGLGAFLLAGSEVYKLALASEPVADVNVALAKMRLTNQYFMDKWPDPGVNIVTNRSRASNIWTRATYYEGLMALYGIDPNQGYYDYAVEWGESHDWDLRDGNTYTRNADNQCCGQTYIDLYLIDPKPERIANIKASVDAMLATDKIDDWTWIDALQMAMPVFARLGVVYQNDDYFDRLYEMYTCTKTQLGESGLYNTVDHLWWRDADYDPPYVEPSGEDCYWSRGNGWVLAALVRCLEIMPEEAAGRDDYLQTFQEMATALIEVQRPDGFWSVSLHDPNHYPGRETTGTAFFAYGLAWGVNQGILDAETVKPVALKAWNALILDAVQPNGFLGYVQGTGKEPSAGQPVTYISMPDFEDYGLGAFLLAGSEIYKMGR